MVRPACSRSLALVGIVTGNVTADSGLLLAWVGTGGLSVLPPDQTPDTREKLISCEWLPEAWYVIEQAVRVW